MSTTRSLSRESPERPILGVGQLLAGLSGLFEHHVGRIRVVGEISNLHQARSGHAYFTLKDEDGQIRAALFRGAAGRLRFELEEGLEVVVEAEVSIYAARGDLQLIVRGVEPRGLGALQLAFEQLRRRLEAEGLFDPASKRPIPVHPRRIGLVTSPTGAAIRDVLEVTGQRFPGIPILIAPCLVQGESAPSEIARAIGQLAQFDDVDVVLLVRGGGSIEDLQAFNSEQVARAVRASRTPVVSGVGHETDFTIADLGGRCAGRHAVGGRDARDPRSRCARAGRRPRSAAIARAWSSTGSSAPGPGSPTPPRSWQHAAPEPGSSGPGCAKPGRAPRFRRRSPGASTRAVAGSSNGRPASTRSRPSASSPGATRWFDGSTTAASCALRATSGWPTGSSCGFPRGASRPASRPSTRSPDEPRGPLAITSKTHVISGVFRF